MELKNKKSKLLKKQKLKDKFINHMIIHGKKLKSEKNLRKNLKALQKIEQKSHNKLLGLAILNTMPIFRIIELKKKSKKKKNQIKEVPAFLSDSFFRMAWAVKYLVKSTKRDYSKPSDNTLSNKIAHNSQNAGPSIEFKKQIQKQALKKQELFRYYRW